MRCYLIIGVRLLKTHLDKQRCNITQKNTWTSSRLWRRRRRYRVKNKRFLYIQHDVSKRAICIFNAYAKHSIQVIYIVCQYTFFFWMKGSCIASSESVICSSSFRKITRFRKQVSTSELHMYEWCGQENWHSVVFLIYKYAKGYLVVVFTKPGD